MKMKRVFLKLSGEALAGPKKTGFDEDTVKEVARQVKLLERPYQRRHRPYQGGPDRNVSYRHELYLRI